MAVIFKYFAGVSPTLQNILAKNINARNHISGESFKLKLRTCVQSIIVGTCTKFQFEILTINVISAIHEFWKNTLRSFQYYGAHVWNMLPINIKAAHSLHEFKSLIRSWPGPTCSCHICIALLWLMLLLCIAHCGGGLSVWRLCGRLWHRVVVTTTCGAVESS